MLLQPYIAGKFGPSKSNSSILSLNPTNPSDTVAEVPVGSPDDVSAAVSAAQVALDGWSSLSGPARADHLYRWAGAIESRSTELAEAIVREVGKPIGEAKGEVGRCVALLRFYAGEAVRDLGEVIPAQTADGLQFTLRQPLGVVGLITPWNFPLAIPIWKAGPALAFGNTVVFKPSEMSSYCAHLLAETAATLPPGVFNVVYGTGQETGEALVAGCQAISFTGSERVGGILSAQCNARNVKIQCEMGGKNAAIVRADADLLQAANLVAGGAMRFAGQKCTATSRVIVERSIKPAFMDQLRAAIDRLPVGDPSEFATAVGPVISQASRDRIQATIDGQPAAWYQAAGGTADGYFISPTVFDSVDPRGSLAQDEIFGPVLAVIDADDLDDAIRLANSVRFGLSASLFTKDIGSAMRYIRRIEAGLVRVNADTTGVDPHAAFGGVKGSSTHSREQGRAARDFYTEIKTVQIQP